MELMELARQAEPILREAGELVRSMAHPKVYTKEGHANFVTEADLASQKFLLEHLSPLVPEAHFFAEEQKQNRMEPGYNWVIDPIDGTTNFMRGYRPSAISVGLVEDGQGVLGLVLDPWSGELFCGVKGQGAFCNGEPIQAAQVPLENAIVVFGTTPPTAGTWRRPPSRWWRRSSCGAETCGGPARLPWTCAMWPRAGATASLRGGCPPGTTRRPRWYCGRPGPGSGPAWGLRSPSSSWRGAGRCTRPWRRL